MSRERYAAAPSAAWSRWNLRWIPCCSNTSTGCPICCSSSRARRIIAPGRKKRHGSTDLARSGIKPFELALDGIEDRPGQLLRYAFSNRAALDQQHAVWLFDGDVPSIARDAFRPIFEGRRLQYRGRDKALRDVRGNWRAVDQHPDGSDAILLDGLRAVMKIPVVFGEQPQVVVAWDFRDDPSSLRLLRITRAAAALAI